MLSIKVLGGFTIADAGRVVDMLPRRSRGILAYLALQNGQATARDRLATLVWPDSGDGQARHSLRQAAMTLRKHLGPTHAQRIVATRDTLRFDATGVEIDVRRFETLACSATAADLDLAAALYAGELLAGFAICSEPFEEWITGERRRLHDLACTVLMRLARAYAQEGRSDPAIANALRLVTLDPLREDAHRFAMQLYAQSGQRSAALRHFESCRLMLARELGVSPDPATLQLARSIERGAAEWLDLSDAEPQSGPAARYSSLPVKLATVRAGKLTEP